MFHKTPTYAGWMQVKKLYKEHCENKEKSECVPTWKDQAK